MIMGIDPSLVGTGVICLRDGEIERQQLIKTKPTDNHLDELRRLLKIVDEIDFVDVEFAAMEGMAFMARNTTSLVQLSGLNYMIRARMYAYKIPFIIVAPMALKKFITGKGNAPKEFMLMEVYKRFGQEFRDNNLCDAYSLARLAEAYLSAEQNMTVYQQEVIDKLKKV